MKRTHSLEAWLNPNRQSQGRRSHAGNRAERVVENQNRFMAQLGIAYVFRVGTPLQVLGSHGKGVRALFSARSCVDYVGHMPDGRVVMVEAKHLAPRFLASGKPAAPSMGLERVEKHQAAVLDRCHDAGGVAVLLIVYNQGQALYSIPWADVRLGAGRLRGEFLEAYRVGFGRFYLPLREGP